MAHYTWKRPTRFQQWQRRYDRLPYLTAKNQRNGTKFDRYKTNANIALVRTWKSKSYLLVGVLGLAAFLAYRNRDAIKNYINKLRGTNEN